MERGKKFAMVSLGLIFAAGFVAGLAFGPLLQPAEAYGTSSRRHRRHRHSSTEKFRTELHMDEGQAQQLSEIMEETRDEYRQLREEMSPRFQEIRSRTRDRIRGILRPDQLEAFEKMTAERDAKWQQWRKEKEERRRKRDAPQGDESDTRVSEKEE